MFLNLPEQVAPIIQHAGAILISYFGNRALTVNYKENQSPVTQADTESEQYLKQQLAALLPEASIIAEESGGADNTELCWVIDPLDGTTNFAHGLPYFCISVALTYHGNPIFGMIYQPLTHELFYAEKGKGAFLNGEKIYVSHLSELKRGVILIGLPYSKGQAFVHLLKDFEKVAEKSYAIRHMGAAALDQAMVACGRVDGVFFENLAWWDVAAGIIILKEAGAIVTDFEGGEVLQQYTSFIAAAPQLYPKLIKIIK